MRYGWAKEQAHCVFYETKAAKNMHRAEMYQMADVVIIFPVFCEEIS